MTEEDLQRISLKVCVCLVVSSILGLRRLVPTGTGDLSPKEYVLYILYTDSLVSLTLVTV